MIYLAEELDVAFMPEVADGEIALAVQFLEEEPEEVESEEASDDEEKSEDVRPEIEGEASEDSEWPELELCLDEPE